MCLFFLKRVCLVLGLLGCFSIVAADEEAQGKTEYFVLTTIAQLADPLATMADGCMRIESLLGSGTDPHLYRLTRADVFKMRQADMILSVGHLLEAQMVHLLMGLAETKPVYAVGEMVDYKHLLEVSPGVYDPHLWMDPAVWQEVLAVAVAKLGAAVPSCRAQLMAGARDYFQRLRELDESVRYSLRRVPPVRRVLVTSHDAFGYFGRGYDIEVLAVQGLSTDRQVSVKKIDDLVTLLITKNIPVVFIESSVSPRDMRAVIEGAASQGHSIRLGGTLFSDAMGVGVTGTYIGMLKHNIRLIAASFEVELPAPDRAKLVEDL